MEPTHSLEYELNTELATDIQRSLLQFGRRHGWRRDLPLLCGWLVFALLLAWPVMAGWLSPGIGGGILFVATFFVLSAVYRRHWQSYAAATSAVVALHTSDRRVRLEFFETRVKMEAEYFRGEASWTELEEIVVFPSFWALRFSNGGNIVIPAPLVTPELQAFLRAKAALAAAAVYER